MKKWSKVIFDSSTSSQSSESIDIKSELVFYTNRTNDSESYKDKTNQYPKDGYRYRKFPSIRGCNNRQKQNIRENYDQWGQKKILLTNLGIFHIVLFVSPFITGLMTPQISERTVQSCENNIHTRYTQMLYRKICRGGFKLCNFRQWIN